jgi:putative flippase GtrA
MIFFIDIAKPSLDSLNMISTKIAVFNQATVRFVLVGVIGAIVELVLFSGFVRAGTGIMYSNFIAFHCAFFMCFFLHHKYTFQKTYQGKHKVAGDFIKYTGLMYAQFILGSLLLWFLIDKLEWMLEISKVVQIGIVTPVSYAVQKLVIFRLS